MNVAVLLLPTALVIVVALLAAIASAGKLARRDGVTYPASLSRAAVTFAAVLILATTMADTFATLLS